MMNFISSPLTQPPFLFLFLANWNVLVPVGVTFRVGVVHRRSVFPYLLSGELFTQRDLRFRRWRGFCPPGR